MSRLIYWIEVIERKEGTIDDVNVINEYPFPEVELIRSSIVSLQGLITLMGHIPDRITRECNETRLHFIMNRWHVGKFVRVVTRDWKYAT
jgi:hypothetical protein